MPVLNDFINFKIELDLLYRNDTNFMRDGTFSNR